MSKLFDLFYKCTKVCTDTRQISDNVLFIALKGENFNGNEFAQKAISLGAKYAIVDELEYANNDTIFYVENTLTYLQQLANFHRLKFNIPVIGITGSNGKTTTKELIASVLKQKFNIHYTAGNLNNHIGVPLTLLGITNEHDIAIIEMGANKPGDITELCEIATPTHGIITNIGKAHLEGFGGEQGVLTTKKGMYDAVQKYGGTLFVNVDDSILTNILPKNTEHIGYSQKKSTAEIVCGKINQLNPNIEFQWSFGHYHSKNIETNIIGSYNLNNILAAICIGNYFEMSPTLINQGIISYIPKNNRSQVEKTLHNTIILDAYNANPTSVLAAIESFAMMKHEDKFFILGDMLELGEESLKLHEQIIQKVKEHKLQGAFVGTIYFQLKDKYDQFLYFNTTIEAKTFFSAAPANGNLILIKGSRSIGLESLREVL